jgi:AraC-like DNA-binding protein
MKSLELLVDFVLIVGILLNIFVLVGLIRIKNRKLPQQILIAFWLLVLVNILHSYSALHNLRWFNRTTFIFEDGSRFILAPLIFIYFKSLFFKETNFIKKNSIHFIAFFIYFLIYTIPRFVNIFTEPDTFTHLYFIYRNINITLVKDIFFISYCMLTLHLFYRVKKTMKHHYSNIKEKDFSWLQIFLLSITAVIFVDLILTLSEIFFNYNVFWDDFITLIFLIIAMVFLGYNGLKQSTIFLPYFILEKQKSNSNYVISKPDESSDALKLKIKGIIEDDKMYLNPDLNLRALSEKVNLSERQLSSFLNNEMQVSFYDLINSYRISEAKKRLLSKDYDKFTMEGIGESCGFKSRSTFFKIFKQETGISPSVYKKKNTK